MKPKLLVVTSTFPRWQNDTDPPFVYELSRRLIHGYRIAVHTPHYPGSKNKEVMDGMDIYRFRYFFSRLEKLAGSTGILPTLRCNKLYYGIVPFFLLAQFVSLLRLVRRIRPDVIHAHWIIPQGFLAVLVALITGVPVIVTAHGSDVLGLQGSLCKRIKRFTLKRVEEVTVVSSILSPIIDSLSPVNHSSKIISMGVDSSVFSPESKNDSVREKYAIKGPFLLYVGRLTETKGVRYLISAMESVVSNFATVTLLIIGGGELEDELKKQVVTLGLSGNVKFVGSIPNMELPVFYATADVFIGPSIEAVGGETEGLGLTFIEAGMSGCLVVASDVGGIKDTIQDNETGFLVKPQSTNLLAEKICYVVEKKDTLQGIGQKSRQHCIEKYDWNVIATHYGALLKKTAAPKNVF